MNSKFNVCSYIIYVAQVFKSARFFRVIDGFMAQFGIPVSKNTTYTFCYNCMRNSDTCLVIIHNTDDEIYEITG